MRENSDCSLVTDPDEPLTEGEEVSAPCECDDLPCDTNAESKAAEVSARATNKSHLTSSVPRAARVPGGVMSKGQMAEIRAIFGDIDDAEIQRLYKRVTK